MCHAVLYRSDAIYENCGWMGQVFFTRPRRGAFDSSSNSTERRADDDDLPTTANNPLCSRGSSLLWERNVSELGFPVLSMLSESPALANCVRYVLEVAWSDILEEFLPFEDAVGSEDNAVLSMHADASAQIGLWKTRCEVKLAKLKSCQAQAAFSYDYSKEVESRGLLHHSASCPFKLDSELGKSAVLLYTPCLVSMNNYGHSTIHNRNLEHFLFDPHLLVREHTGSRDTEQAQRQGATAGAVRTLSIADFGCSVPLQPEKCSQVQARVFHAMDMLVLRDSAGAGVADLPDLSRNFVMSLLAEEEALSSETSNDETAAGLFRGNPVRRSGLVATRRGYDFLFPSSGPDANVRPSPGGASGDDSIASDVASSQCFESIPYWPTHWQAPFGEILHESYENVAAYSNYMALLKPTEGEECEETGGPGAGGVKCGGRMVVLPDHLRFENLTTGFFGTGGLCREHSFGMPLIPTNTMAMCTSSLRNEDSTDKEVDSFDCQNDNNENCACSDSAQVGMGGGLGNTLGHLWPLFRMFLDENPTERQSEFGYAFNNTFFEHGSEHIMAGLLEHIGTHDLSIYVHPPDELESVDHIVRERCYSAQVYAIEEELDTAGTSQHCVPAAAAGQQQQQRCCHYNEQCENTSQVCTAAGVCEDLDIDIENQLAESVEIGITCKACSAVDQDEFSGASPWRRMGDILEQHGMCSHLNRVTYERMNDMLDTRHEALGCTQHDGPDGLDYYVCPRSAINWTWVRERPGFIYGENEATAEDTLDTRQNHIETSVLTDGLFDLHPHICDVEYMHSHTLAWCELQHRAGATATAGDAAPTPSQEYSRWMRTAHRHKDFSTLRPIQPDVRDKNDAPFEKMRFMGLNSDMIKHQPKDSGLRDVIAVQQCGSMGICETESFTFGGIHCVRKRQVIPAPVRKFCNFQWRRHDTMRTHGVCRHDATHYVHFGPSGGPAAVHPRRSPANAAGSRRGA